MAPNAKPLTLREKQGLFTYYVAMLIIYANDQGYELTFGEAYRSKEEAARLATLGKGIKNSLHTQRLAIDFNLFKDGKYLTTTEAHRPLGEFWEGLHPSCRWGGHFSTRPDGNHYEFNPKGAA